MVAVEVEEPAAGAEEPGANGAGHDGAERAAPVAGQRRVGTAPAVRATPSLAILRTV
jgi:hypothetical protein